MEAMPDRKTPAPDDPEQSKRFIDAAIEAGPDETGEKFEGAFRKVSRQKKSQDQSPKNK